MGTKQVRLDEDVYAKIQDRKREGETFSDAIDRLTDDWSLAEWGEQYSTDPAEVQDHLDTLDNIERVDREEQNSTVPTNTGSE